jgi:hypothetical protein
MEGLDSFTVKLPPETLANDGKKRADEPPVGLDEIKARGDPVGEKPCGSSCSDPADVACGKV